MEISCTERGSLRRSKQRLREKEERDRLKAKKAAEVAERKDQRERDKQARDARKAIQLPPRGKHKASQQLQSDSTKKRSDAAAHSYALAFPTTSTDKTTVSAESLHQKDVSSRINRIAT